MAKAKYKITKEDQSTAYFWIEKKLNEYNFLTEEKYTPAEKDFITIAKKPTAKKLNEWCENYLNKEQWKKLKGAIRAKRKRSTTKPDDKKISTDLDFNAWRMLSAVAKSEKITLSQAIEKNISKAYLKAIKSDSSLQKEFKI